MTIRFSNKLVAELVQPFWSAWQAGEFLTDAAGLARTDRHRGLGWLREAGGVRPRRGRDLQGRYLSFAEREEIALGRARGDSVRAIAARLGRAASTVSGELSRNRDRQGSYRASVAHARAWERAARPKPAKLATHQVLRDRVQLDLEKKSLRSRSRAGCGTTFPAMRLCGCRPRPSTSRYMSKPEAGCDAI